MIYPKFLNTGDTIGICAPSAGVGEKEDFFDLSVETLMDAGYEVVETDNVRSDECPSAPAVVRGEEFNSLILDDNINMVMSAAGGDFVMEMLPYIDQAAVREHPKWFAGYSDPTSIEMLLTTRLDIATIYGVNAGSFDWRPLHEYQENALAVFRGDIPVQYSYDLWASYGFDEELGEFVMDEPVEWLLFRGCGDDLEPEICEDYELDVTGRLIGGCIDVIDWIVGTPYEDLEGFCERYKDDGFIWFFDNFELDPMQMMYALLRLRQKGLFDNARAVVFGRPCFTGDADDEEYLEAAERVFGDIDVPFIWNADIGHTKPSFTIINGAVGHLTFDYDSAVLTMELK